MSSRPEVQIVMPSLEPWHRWLLGGLFGLYVLELVLANTPLPLYSLAWWPFEQGFGVWQPLTRFLVQGADRRVVFNVLFSLVVLYFFLPAMESMFRRRDLGFAVAAGAVGGTLLPLVLNAVGLVASGMPALGWGPLTLVLPVLFGLHRPDQDILLLVFPIKARWFLWGALVVALLSILVERTLDTWQELGVWLGAVGWYQLLGPGRRKRDLRARAAGIERELSRFQVLDGGRGTPRPQRGQRGDDTVH